MTVKENHRLASNIAMVSRMMLAASCFVRLRWTDAIHVVTSNVISEGHRPFEFLVDEIKGADVNMKELFETSWLVETRVYNTSWDTEINWPHEDFFKHIHVNQKQVLDFLKEIFLKNTFDHNNEKLPKIYELADFLESVGDWDKIWVKRWKQTSSQSILVCDFYEDTWNSQLKLLNKWKKIPTYKDLAYLLYFDLLRTEALQEIKFSKQTHQYYATFSNEWCKTMDPAVRIPTLVRNLKDDFDPAVIVFTEAELMYPILNKAAATNGFNYISTRGDVVIVSKERQTYLAYLDSKPAMCNFKGSIIDDVEYIGFHFPSGSNESGRKECLELLERIGTSTANHMMMLGDANQDLTSSDLINIMDVHDHRKSATSSKTRTYLQTQRNKRGKYERAVKDLVFGKGVEPCKRGGPIKSPVKSKLLTEVTTSGFPVFGLIPEGMMLPDPQERFGFSDHSPIVVCFEKIAASTPRRQKRRRIDKSLEST